MPREFLSANLFSRRIRYDALLPFFLRNIDERFARPRGSEFLKDRRGWLIARHKETVTMSFASLNTSDDRSAAMHLPLIEYYSSVNRAWREKSGSSRDSFLQRRFSNFLRGDRFDRKRKKRVEDRGEKSGGAIQAAGYHGEPGKIRLENLSARHRSLILIE